jgi:hypothetical protein
LQLEQRLKKTRNSEFSDRRKTAGDAKAALLHGFRAAKESAEPTQLARQAERRAVASAREERRATRERVKAEERERIQAESAEREAAIAAEARAQVEAQEAADKNRVARVIQDDAARKAERDRRYANRKAKQA